LFDVATDEQHRAGKDVPEKTWVGVFPLLLHGGVDLVCSLSANRIMNWRKSRRSRTTHRTRVYGEGIDVIAIRLDDALHQPVLDPQDDSQLAPAVQLCRPDLGIVDLVHRSKMHDRRRPTVHLGRLPNNPRRRRVGHLGRFADERVEQIAGVEVAEPVDAKVAVDAVGVFAVFVGVDAGGEDELP